MQKKRIVLDARMVGPHGHGIANYVLDLAAALGARDLPYDLVFLISPECPPDSLLRKSEHAESAIPFLHPREIFGLAREIRALNPDLFHSPSFSSLRNYPCPHMLTVHDLNHLHFAGIFHRLYYRYLLLPAMQNAKAVLSVSRTAAAEIEGWMKAKGHPRTIEVVPNSIRPLPTTAPEKGNYFFCLSNPKPFKNTEFLKSAYRAAREGHELPELWISTPGQDEPGIRHLGALPGHRIGPLLAGAKAFFFPSKYEGFGRPPVESALAGTLPVVSDLPVLREGLLGISETRFLLLRQELWVQEIRKLAREPKHPVSPESRQWILQQYSLEEVARTADEIYRRALA